jgi:hypothetical protein
MHTKGPWKAVFNEKRGWQIEGDVHNDPVATAREGKPCYAFYPVATISPTCDGEANARLIAAAPKLLAACEAAVHSHNNDLPINWPVMRAAIAEAKE